MGASISVKTHSELERMAIRQQKTEARLAEKLEKAEARLALKCEKAEAKLALRNAHREEVKQRREEAKQQAKAEAKAEAKQRKLEEKRVKDEVRNEELAQQRIEKKQKKEEEKREKELAAAKSKLNKELAKAIKDADKKVQKARKIADMEISRVEKEMVFKVMAFVGKLLMTQYPDGFDVVTFGNAVLEYYGNKNLWTGELYPNALDTKQSHASIRSLVYECSPSSSRHWFKYGIRRGAGEIAPWLFVNRKLAELNNQYEWKVTEEGKSNGRGGNGGKWIFVADLFDNKENWPVDLYGPLPTEEQLTEAENGRIVGIRNGGGKGRRNERLVIVDIGGVNNNI